MIAAGRSNSESYTAEMPNFLVQQVTTRYYTLQDILSPVTAAVFRNYRKFATDSNVKFGLVGARKVLHRAGGQAGRKGAA